MQKFDIQHTFNCDAQRLYDLMSNDDFDSQIMSELNIQKETLKSETNGTGPYYELRVCSAENIPEAFRSLIGDQLVYVEKRQWDAQQLGNTWQIETDFMSDKIDIRGSVHITHIGHELCQRQILGEINIKIPLIGKKIETKIIEILTENFQKNRDLIQKHLQN